MTNFNKIFKNYLEEREFNTSRLLMKDSLHPDFWTNEQLDPKIMLKLVEIAEDLVEGIQKSLLKLKAKKY